MRELVILRNCQEYDSESIREIIAQGIKELGIKPKEKVFIKPNGVFVSPYAYTHPAVIKGLVLYLKGLGVERIILGEDSGLMVPTRYVFERTGYKRLSKEMGFDCMFMDEVKRDTLIDIPDGVVHKKLKLPRAFVDSFRIYLPKLKTHFQTQISCASKLAMGICDRRERLLGHHYKLEEKIVDLLKGGFPELIIVDSIVMGIGSAGSPLPYPLGLLIMGKNPIAVDSVASHILSLNPEDIPHLRIGHNRGYGPINLEDIEIRGDITLEEAKKRALGWKKRVPKIDKVRLFIGRTPYVDRCPGGCFGFAEESILFIESFRKRRPDRFIDRVIRWILGSRKRKIGLVLGDYKGKIPEDIEEILLIGDCAKVDYNGRKRRIKGCPVYMGRQVWWISKLSGLPNPWLDRREAFSFIKNSILKAIKLFLPTLP